MATAIKQVQLPISFISLQAKIADAMIDLIKAQTKPADEMTEHEQEHLAFQVQEILDACVNEAFRFVRLRRHTLLRLLVERGGFSDAEGWALFYKPDTDSNDRPELERRAAIWLGAELQKLKLAGPSPVRTRGLLSSLQIADLAIAILETHQSPGPTTELIELLTRLLEVDRHRLAMANLPEFNEKFLLAASIDGEAARQNALITVRKLAKHARVSMGTISAWRKLQSYKNLVQLFVQQVSAR
jgi:hypothetical protein